MLRPLEVSPEAIGAVLKGLLAGIDQDRQDASAAVADLPQVRLALEKARAGDFNGFHFGLVHPWSEMMDGLLAREFPTSWEAQFLLKECGFVQRHIEQIIVQIEGRACSADKSATVMHALLVHLITGREIAFDRYQRYTFHLPQRVFSEQAEIVDFFRGLVHLHAGRPQKFFECHAAIAARIGQITHPSDLDAPATLLQNGATPS